MNVIEHLEKAKKDILDELDFYYEESFFTQSEFKNDPDNENYKECRRIIKELAKEGGIRIPHFIKEARTVEEVTEAVIYEGEDNNLSIVGIKNYVSRSINEYADYIEEKNISVEITHVEPKIPEKLTYQSIKNNLESCEQRLHVGDYSGAVTSARTLVEGVCKEILINYLRVEVKENIKLPELFSSVRKHLNLDPKDEKLDKTLKEVLSGLIKIVSGISEVRNDYGDAHSSKDLIKEHHAKMVVNSSKTVVDFLFKTYEYQAERGILAENL